MLPLFLESPFFLCVCANKTNTRCYKKTEEGAERERENGEEGEKRERERFARGRGRRTRSLSSLSHFLFFLIASLGRGYCYLSSSGLSSFLSLSFRSCPRSALFSPPSAQQLQRRLAKQGERGQKVPFIRTPMPTPSASSPRASAAASSAPSTSRSTIEDGTPLLQSE